MEITNAQNKETTDNRFCCQKFSLQHIRTIDEVKCFAKYLVNDLEVNFHPDEDFSNYISLETSEQTFNLEEQEVGNRLMDESFDVCEKEGADVYEVMGEYLFSRLATN